MADLLQENDNNKKQAPETGATGPKGNQSQADAAAFNFFFDQGIGGGDRSALGEKLTHGLNKEHDNVLNRIARPLGVPSITVESTYITGSSVGSNADMLALFAGPYKGRTYVYMVALSDTPAEVTPAFILQELTQTNPQARKDPLAAITIQGLGRLIDEVHKNISMVKGNSEFVQMTLIDGRGMNASDKEVINNLQKNFIQVLIKAVIGGTLPTTVSGTLKRYRPNSIVASPVFSISGDKTGSKLNELGEPVRADWTIDIRGIGQYDQNVTMIKLDGYNDVVITNSALPNGQTVNRVAPHLICTNIDLPAGGAADDGSVLLAVSTMNAMSSHSMPIVPFMRMKGGQVRDPMAFDVITGAMQQNGVDPKRLGKKIDNQTYYTLVMKHFAEQMVARSIDVTENTPMATLCAGLLEVALDFGTSNQDATSKLYNKANELTDGMFGKVTGGKMDPVFANVYTLPAGFIKTRSGEMIDIRNIDVVSILTKKYHDPNSINYLENAVKTMLSDVRSNQALGWWAGVMNLMAPEAHVTGLTYRMVFNPAFINNLTKAINGAGFMPNILPGDMDIPGMQNAMPAFSTSNWVATPTMMGSGFTMPNDFSHI